MPELQQSTAMPIVTALSGAKGGDFYPLPLTRAWTEDYRRWFVAQLRAPAVLAKAPELSTLCGLEPGLGERLETDQGSCHCGRPGAFLEQRANGWIWYCSDHRPNYRVCHICGQPGVAFTYVGERWLWYCQAHVG